MRNSYDNGCNNSDMPARNVSTDPGGGGHIRVNSSLIHTHLPLVANWITSVCTQNDETSTVHIVHVANECRGVVKFT